ncbi:hypothetical protein EDB83DRAFT_2318745 [Lactarius deliciosus]|nr:hypothetical protein EDB83DRAFT_2318745 [Lactarius deliciosus]
MTISMASKPQETSAIGSSTTLVPRERKKDQHVSGSACNMLSKKIAKEIITRSAAKRSAANVIGEAATGTASKTRKCTGDNHPSATNPKVKGKGDQDKKTVSRKGKPLHQEENLDNDWEDGAQPLNKTREESNEEALPSEGKDDNNIVKQLEREVENLKIRCDSQEKTIEDLKLRCDSHEKVLELHRQEINTVRSTMGKYKLIGRVQGLVPWSNTTIWAEFSQEHPGPIQAHWQGGGIGTMGQWKPVGRIQLGAPWANTSSLAGCMDWCHGPIKAFQQNMVRSSVGQYRFIGWKDSVRSTVGQYKLISRIYALAPWANTSLLAEYSQ